MKVKKYLLLWNKITGTDSIYTNTIIRWTKVYTYNVFRNFPVKIWRSSPSRWASIIMSSIMTLIYGSDLESVNEVTNMQTGLSKRHIL